MHIQSGTRDPAGTEAVRGAAGPGPGPWTRDPAGTEAVRGAAGPGTRDPGPGTRDPGPGTRPGPRP